MNIQSLETALQWLGAGYAFLTLGIVLYGVWRGTQQPAGRTIGLSGSWLRSWWFYLASSLLFFGLAHWGWIPLPLALPPSLHILLLIVGGLLYFPGMSILLWARWTLGKNYFVSTGFGAQLFKDHELITSGPYAIIRHPMYAGLILAAWGSLLIYGTWTTVYFAGFAPLMFFRARNEERALSAEFGEQWNEYCQRVPAFFPQFGDHKGNKIANPAHPEMGRVPETYLAPLYWKAVETQRPDAILKDEKALALLAKGTLDFSRVRPIRMNELLHAMRIILTREMDRHARDFLNRHPDAVVVHIGCGLDSRFERVDNGRVEWYDLDLPETIALRRRLIGDDHERYHHIGCSVLDDQWLETVAAHSSRAFLFLAETVFVYFTEKQVRSLVLKLSHRFPDSELVFDGWKPFEVWIGNRYLSQSFYAGLMQWGFWNGSEIEKWGHGIRLLDTWSFFGQPEVRLNSFRWAAPLFRWLKPIVIFHFQLGK